MTKKIKKVQTTVKQKKDKSDNQKSKFFVIKESNPSKLIQAPKRAISAFFYYFSERVEVVKQQQSNLSNKERVRIISEEWNVMSDSMKSKYYILADKDKMRYEKEKKDYDNNKTSKEEEDDDDEEEDNNNEDDEEDGAEEQNEEENSQQGKIFCYS
jgi:hypothetical protein